MANSSKIKLTSREQQLRNLLVDVAAFIDARKTVQEPLILRWAGGWVRDKLLEVDSHDIDVAINCMTGLTFGEQMREYCDVPHNAAKHGVGPDDIGNLHHIAANPEKSKNLETTTVRVFGLDVDFVNLRTETYADNSRNPVVQFGTAQEDALRRDATVNALFYNLHTGEIEDFTGGLADMKAKLIRTPMEPLQTFMDDPLRVLRLVRFASRLSFSIDPVASSFMANPEVLNSFRIKISRERVGVEVEKMLRGRHPRRALELVDKYGLYSTVFTDPARNDLPEPRLGSWRSAYSLIDSLAKQRSPGSLYDILVRTEEDAYYAWVLTAVTPWAHVTDPLAATKTERSKGILPTAATALKEGTKAPNKLCEAVSAAQRNLHEILRLKADVCAGSEARNERDTIGMAIRSWDARGGHWRLQVMYAVLVEVMDRHGEAGASADLRGPLVSEWQVFLEHLIDQDLMDVTSLKRLVDGTMLAKALGVKPGKWVGRALDVCLSWQLRHPAATNPAAAIEEVRQRSDELDISLPKK